MNEGASRMKLSSHLHAPCYTLSNKNKYDLDVACQIFPVMSVFKEPGWPVRSNFRYTYKQKKVLYEIYKLKTKR